MAGIISDAFSMGAAILWVSISAWGFGILFLIGILFFIDQDVKGLRREMAARARMEKAGNVL